MMLKPYMVHMGEPAEGAALVFAHNSREAKLLGWQGVSWLDCPYIEIRVKRLSGNGDHLRKGDQPHVIWCPPCCDRCELWKLEKYNDEGLCRDCAEDGEMLDDLLATTCLAVTNQLKGNEE
jgi:hypothetical protein